MPDRHLHFRTYVTLILLGLFLVVAALVFHAGKASLPVTSEDSHGLVKAAVSNGKKLAMAAFAWDPPVMQSAITHLHTSGVDEVRAVVDWGKIQWRTNDESIITETVEQWKDTYDWSSMDTIMNMYPTGMTTWGELGPFNLDWDLRESGNRVPCSWNNALTYCTNVTETLPDIATRTRPSVVNPLENWSDWDHYVYRAVSRYGPNANGLGAGFGQGKIHEWEVLNEVDNFLAAPYGGGVKFTDSELAQRGTAYGNLVKRTAEIIKLADPNAKIISAGLADYDPDNIVPGRASILDRTNIFLNAFAATGALDSIDAFGIHPYAAVNTSNGLSLTPYLTDLETKLTALAGGALPIWATEIGFTSDSQNNLCASACQANATTEASLLVQTLTQAFASPQVTNVTWYGYNFFSVPTETDPAIASYSLLGWDGGASDWIDSNRANAFYYFNTLMQGGGYSFVSYQLSSNNHVFKFANGTNSVYIVWTPNASSHYAITLDSSQNLHTYDLDGVQISNNTGSGIVNVSTGHEPVYVVVSNSTLCAAFTYSNFGTCQSNGTQTRTVVSSSPANCSGGITPTLTQNCTPACTAFTYSSWSTCDNNVQTRTIATRTPSSCASGVSPVLSQSCIPCSDYTYSDWGPCTNNTQTRTVATSTPANCSPSANFPPSLTRSCATYPACKSVTYTDWGPCLDNRQTRSTVKKDPITCFDDTIILEQSCKSAACTDISYTDWGNCVNGTQTRSIKTKLPAGCDGTVAVLSQTCGSSNSGSETTSGNSDSMNIVSTTVIVVSIIAGLGAVGINFYNRRLLKSRTATL